MNKKNIAAILTFSAFFITGGILMTFANEKPDAPLRLFVEAEAFGSMQRYPYDHEWAESWYAREFVCRAHVAPGLGFAAVITDLVPESGRTVEYKLEKPVPAGKYKVFLRTRGPTIVTDETCVRIGLGNTSAEVRWTDAPARGRRFAWQPGVVVETDGPVDTIAMTAVSFGGRGMRALYDPMRPYICVDTIYITGALEEDAPPELEAERMIRAGMTPEALPERRSFTADAVGVYDPVTPRPEAEAITDPILLRSFDGRRNIWPNSFFELGMNDGWAANTRFTKHVFSDVDLSDENPFHGRYSLHVPSNTAPFSRPYRLEEGGEYTLSMFARGSGKVYMQLRRMTHIEIKHNGRPFKPEAETSLSASMAAGDEWGRMSVTGTLEPGWYYLYIKCSEESWLDAVQLECGAEATAFEPRAVVEGAIRSGGLANIIYDSETETLPAWFHNSGETDVTAALWYRIVDWRESVVGEGVTDPILLSAGATVKKELPILPELRGIFSVTFGIAGRDVTEGETVYVLMPAPVKEETRHELGGNMGVNPTEMKVQSRLGLKWVLTCKSRAVSSASESIHKEQGKWEFRDDLAAMPAEYGMGLIPNFWPNRIPAYMQTEVTGKYRPMRGRVKSKIADLELWSEHVSKVAAHYEPHIKIWCLEDEMEYSGWDPALVLPLLQATSAAVRRSAPGVKLGLSCDPEYIEELLELGYSPDDFDYFGGSYFDYRYWAAKHVRRLQERFDRHSISYGVGARPPSLTMYHTGYAYYPVRPKIGHMARQIVNQLLVQDLKIIGHYAAVFWNDGIHQTLNKPLCDYDGTPLPWGAVFGLIGTLLADAEPGDDIALGTTDRMAHVFRTGDTLGVVTWASNIRDYDFHWRPAWREIKDLQFDCAPEDIEILDMFWNRRDDIRIVDGKVSFDINEEPMFVLNKKLSDKRFFEVIESATFAEQPLDVSMRFVPVDGAALGLEVAVQNRTDSELKDVSIDLRFPPDANPWSAAVPTILPYPLAHIDSVSARGTGKAVLPVLLDGKTPFEVGTARANMTAADGIEFSADAMLYYIPGFRVSGEFQANGDVSKWESMPAAWLAFAWSGNVLGRATEQMYSGGQHFQYPPCRLDARAALWTGWDAENLYVALRLEDDELVLQPETGEQVRIEVGTKEKRISVNLNPLADGSVLIEDNAGAGVSARSKTFETVIEDGARLEKKDVVFLGMEIVVPFKAIGIIPEPGTALEFDLYWTDADHEDGKLTHATLRWAGGTKSGGTLVLR